MGMKMRIYLLSFACLLSLLSPIAFGAGFLPKGFEAQFFDVRGSVKIPVTIKYQFPKQIYYEVKGDAPLLYVCNESKTWKYTPPFMEGEKGELAVGDSSQFCYSRIFDSLSNGLVSNELYTVVNKGANSTLSFKEKAKKQLGLDRIEIQFKTSAGPKSSLADAKELKMFLSSKPEPVKLVLKTYKSNPKFKDGQFSFKAPDNTNTTLMR